MDPNAPIITAVPASSQNDFDFGDAAAWARADLARFNPAANSTVTGLLATYDGHSVLLVNISGFVVTLALESTSSTAANRFAQIATGESSVLLHPRSMTRVVYDGTSARWRLSGELRLSDAGALALPDASSDPPAPAAGLSLFVRKVAGAWPLPAYMPPSGLDSALQPYLARNAIGSWRASPGSTGLNGHGLVLSSTGTATATAPTSTNLATSTVALEFAVTTAATTAVGGFRVGTAATGLTMWRGNAAGLGGFKFVARFRSMRAWPATQRMFCGITSATAAPTDVQPSSLTNMIGVGYDAADSNWQIMSNDGTGTATKVDTGIARPTSDNQLLELVMWATPNGSEVYVAFSEFVSAASFSTTRTTDLPGPTQFLTPRGFKSVGGTSSTVGFGLLNLYVETDY